MIETNGKPSMFEPGAGESEDHMVKKNMTTKRILQEIMREPALRLKVTALVCINTTHTKDKNVNILSPFKIRD